MQASPPGGGLGLSATQSGGAVAVSLDGVGVEQVAACAAPGQEADPSLLEEGAVFKAEQGHFHGVTHHVFVVIAKSDRLVVGARCRHVIVELDAVTKQQVRRAGAHAGVVAGRPDWATG